MEDVNDWYTLILFILNKNQQGYLAPSKFNLIINEAQNMYQSFLLGSFQAYTPGRAVARVELGQNAVIRQRLAPTIKKALLTIEVGGTCVYPDGYIQSDSMLTDNNKRIKLVQQDSLYSYLSSTIDPVETNPIYLIEDANFQFYPLTLGEAKLTYVQKAPAITWAFTLDVNNRPIYDAGTSVQPVWDSIAKMDIIARALSMVGVNLQAGAVAQFANQIKAQGQ